MQNTVVMILATVIGFWIFYKLGEELWCLIKTYTSASRPQKQLSFEVLSPDTPIPPSLEELTLEAVSLGFTSHNISRTTFERAYYMPPGEVIIYDYRNHDYTTLLCLYNTDGISAWVETWFPDDSVIVTRYLRGASVETPKFVAHYGVQSLKSIVEYQMMRVADWTTTHGKPVSFREIPLNDHKRTELYNNHYFMVEFAVYRKFALRVIGVVILALLISLSGLIMLYFSDLILLSFLLIAPLPILVRSVGRELVYHPRFFTKPPPIDAPAS